MTETIEYTRVGHTLPANTSHALTVLDSADRDSLIRQLREAGWTLQSIADSAGLTRERVRQIVAATPAANEQQFALPMPPTKPRREPRVYVEPDPSVLTRLLELQPVAQSVRANSGAGRSEAEEYTRLIATEHERGVTLYRLAKRLGVTHGALRFRLARYGYKQPANGGSSKVYAPIKDENRA